MIQCVIHCHLHGNCEMSGDVGVLWPFFPSGCFPPVQETGRQWCVGGEILILSSKTSFHTCNWTTRSLADKAHSPSFSLIISISIEDCPFSVWGEWVYGGECSCVTVSISVQEKKCWRERERLQVWDKWRNIYFQDTANWCTVFLGFYCTVIRWKMYVVVSQVYLFLSFE